MRGSVRALATVIADAGLRRAVVAYAGFYFAEWATWIAMLVYAFERGGATEAGVVALIQLIPASIVAPLAAANPGIRPELLVLATGAGSVILSHVNDGGFWLVKEYFRLSVTDTIKSWTVCETLISVVGLLLTLALSTVV